MADICKEPKCTRIAHISGRCFEHDEQFVRERQNDPAAQAARTAAAAAVHAAAAQSELAEAQAEAVRRDTKRKDKQAFAALDAEQREALMVREKRDADREKLKQAFDRLGDCVACIEQEGAATAAFNHTPFGGNEYENGHPAMYRYANLSAARAVLLDLREELGRVEHWEASTPREQTLARIEQQLALAKEGVAKQARRAKEGLAAHHSKTRGMGLGSLAAAAVLGAGAFLIDNFWALSFGVIFGAFAGMAGLSAVLDPEGWDAEGETPPNWQDILDAAA